MFSSFATCSLSPSTRSSLAAAYDVHAERFLEGFQVLVVNAEKGPRPFLGNRNLFHVMKALTSRLETPTFRKCDNAKASRFLKLRGWDDADRRKVTTSEILHNST